MVALLRDPHRRQEMYIKRIEELITANRNKTDYELAKAMWWYFGPILGHSLITNKPDDRRERWPDAKARA